MITDAAAGYAAMTMVPTEASVLTAEYKINFMAPARGEGVDLEIADQLMGQYSTGTTRDISLSMLSVSRQPCK